MVSNVKKILGVVVASVCLSFAATLVHAATPDEILQQYTTEAKKDKTFKGFSADAGKSFFLAERTNKKGEKESCSGCHTKDPTKQGKTRAGKVIEPMAVSANKERYTDKAKVEKWFKRNCQDVYDRPCTAQEKGDFITFMKSK